MSGPRHCLSFRGGPNWAAVAVILNEVDEVLVIRRVKRSGDPWSGHAALPGGKWKPGETLIATAIREAEEEVGIRLGLGNLVGILGPKSPRNAPHIKVLPVVFRTGKVDPTINRGEVEEAVWVSLDTLKRSHVSGGRPHYKVGNMVVWGLTYRILRSLLACLEGAR